MMTQELSPPSLKTLGVRSSSQWDARRTWHMPPAIRAAFNAHVHRLCAVQFAPWCSLCHRDAPERSAAHYGIWTLRLRVCRGCLRAHLISNRELFETYGVRPSTWIAFEVPAQKMLLCDMMIMIIIISESTTHRTDARRTTRS